MDQDKHLEQQFNEFAELAKEHKDIDVASLMIAAMEKQQDNLVPPSKKRWAYLVSLGLPPFGLLFAIKYYFSAEDDARHVATVCTLLTILSIIGLVIFSQSLFQSAGVNPEQLQQIKPQDIQELVQ